MLQGVDHQSAAGRLNADLAGMDDAALVGVFEDAQRQIAAGQGRQLRAIAALDARRAGTPQHEFVVDEVAFALQVTHTYACSLLWLARVLARRLPGTFTALECGDIDAYKARAIAEYTQDVSAADAAWVENKVLGKAGEQTATELKRSLNRAIHQVDPQAAAKRRRRAEKARDVRMLPEPDGMASVEAYLTAEGAAMIMLVLNGLANAARTQPGETHTVGELRADLLVGIFQSILETGGYAAGPMQTRQGSKPHLQVTVDALTLLGLAQNPGYLAGYGPIPAHVARTLATDATWSRLITDPIDGKLLDYGTSRYRPGAVLAAHVMTRDQTCRFPGCTRPAHGCHLDHTIPYPNGPTADTNLEPLSGHHHRAKHAGFHVEQPTPGTFRWRSPTRHIRLIHPEAIGEPNAATDGWRVPTGLWLDLINHLVLRRTDESNEAA